MFSIGRAVLLLLAGAGLLGTATILSTPGPVADINLSADHIAAVVDETFSTTIEVTAREPVNVFAGEVRFDHTKLRIESIDYNTGVADLWAELPWYSNGDGTLNFTGGTTVPGGFIGNGGLITVTFKALELGETTLNIADARILRHNGLGTDAPLSDPIETIVAIAGPTEQTAVVEKSVAGPTVVITSSLPNYDLNNDGRYSVADYSIFLVDLATQDTRSDFNFDGRVSTADLSLLLAVSSQ